ncbi:hypothetical protein [Oceanobacillus kimchii]|uniref:hypothetical protein n=1 Tax=Oceanobacillus kimchii TaxID=746691 RepID=UPI00233124E3|nr:hypothetical protein [Oceanobacillus kimchii]
MFVYRENRDINEGILTYNESDKTINSIPKINSDITFLIKYINIGFDSESKKATQVWGYHHNFNWISQNLILPEVTCGEVIINKSVDPGDSIRIPEAESWESYIDFNTDWLRIGSAQGIGVRHIEFFTNTVLSIDYEGEIVGIWLKPEFIKED